MVINAGIIGATGYTGEELINILLNHPQVRISYLAAKLEEPACIDKIFPKFKNRIGLTCIPFDINSAVSANCNLFFLALPHTVSMKIVPKLLKPNIRVIDLSADYRLRDVRTYCKFYKAEHSDKHNLKNAVYGLPELYRAKIRKANLVANPGCYPTAAILSLAPLVSCEEIEPGQIIIDAKSGATGAGRQALLEYSFSEINEDASAYKINIHQHIPEINQELSKLAAKAIRVTFVPHILSINRGILETIYLRTSQKPPAAGRLINLYKKFYKREPFARIKKEGESVRVKDVANTNFFDIAIRSFPQQNLIIVVAAIDNLGKGAAGQAIQNMNIMYGFPERAALG
ncbi:MAG: N-acetyl-gamma-glutamyl-phosphate reductase [Candidatus Omnitrophota bacterium]